MVFGIAEMEREDFLDSKRSRNEGGQGSELRVQRARRPACRLHVYRIRSSRSVRRERSSNRAALQILRTGADCLKITVGMPGRISHSAMAVFIRHRNRVRGRGRSKNNAGYNGEKNN